MEKQTLEPAYPPSPVHQRHALNHSPNRPSVLDYVAPTLRCSMLGMTPDTPVQSSLPSEETEPRHSTSGEMHAVVCVRAEGLVKAASALGSLIF